VKSEKLWYGPVEILWGRIIVSLVHGKKLPGIK